MPQARDIRTLDIHGLEETMEKYPWFAVARAEYFAKMAALDREYIRPAARKVGLYVPDRVRLYDRVVLGRIPMRADVRPEEDHRDDAPVEIPREAPVEVPAEPAPQPERRRAPGGDYFSRQDFEELAAAGESYSDLHFTPKSNLASSLDRAAVILTSEKPQQIPDTGEVCTETLAGIYYSQGFYRRAIDIYKKLILFYPEKNTYFAALIERCKEKTKK
ncbi:MAG: hypothetical protein K6G53_08185 [Bacteroidales bacterium]|nr:hypothetical protein [Bacteroidales bacterium]